MCLVTHPFVVFSLAPIFFPLLHYRAHCTQKDPRPATIADNCHLVSIRFSNPKNTIHFLCCRDASRLVFANVDSMFSQTVSPCPVSSIGTVIWLTQMTACNFTKTCSKSPSLDECIFAAIPSVFHSTNRKINIGHMLIPHSQLTMISRFCRVVQ